MAQTVINTSTTLPNTRLIRLRQQVSMCVWGCMSSRCIFWCCHIFFMSIHSTIRHRLLSEIFMFMLSSSNKLTSCSVGTVVVSCTCIDSCLYAMMHIIQHVHIFLCIILFYLTTERYAERTPFSLKTANAVGSSIEYTWLGMEEDIWYCRLIVCMGYLFNYYANLGATFNKHCKRDTWSWNY